MNSQDIKKSISRMRIGGPRGHSSWRYRIGLPLICLLGFIGVSCVGYQWIQDGYTWFDALYMTMITISTVGIKEVGGELSPAGQAWTMFVIAGGLTVATILGSQIAAFVVEGQVQGVIGRRKLQRKISALKDHVIICGFGRMGGMVARELADAKWNVVVVDNDEERTAVAEREGFLCIQGDAQDEEVLEALGVCTAKVLVATLSSDADNLFVTLSARQDSPNLQIIARATKASSQSKLKRAGADRVICPQIIGATRIADVVLRPAMIDFVEMAHSGVDLEMDQFMVDESSVFVGNTLSELNLPRRFGVHLVAVKHANGATNYHPTHDLKLAAGDLLIMVGRVGACDAINELHKA